MAPKRETEVACGPPPESSGAEIVLTVAARAEAVSAALTDLRATLDRRGHRARLDGDWELVLAEACNNVVEHALQYREGANFQIRIRLHPDAIEARLVDRGAPLPRATLPLGRLPSLDTRTDLLPEGGFGWYLIHNLAEEIRYERCCGENRLYLRMKV